MTPLSTKRKNQEHAQIFMAGIFGLAALYLVWSAAPGMLWYDTAEFAAVGARLSISHPPGHPLHALATHMIQVLCPFGDLGFRANILSALFMAFGLAFFFKLLIRVVPEQPYWMLATLALLPLAFRDFAYQGIRAEVYALQMTLSVWTAFLCLKVADGDDARWLVCLAYVFGLAGTNHSYIGAMLIPFALVAMRTGRVSRKGIGFSSLFGLAGLAVYAYLPMRASKGFEVGWGEPNTISSIWETISGRAWRGNLVPNAHESFDGLVNAIQIGQYILHQVGGALLLIMFAGIAVSIAPWWKVRDRMALTIVLVAVLPFALRTLNEFDPANPDMGGYLMTGFLGGIALFAYALQTTPWNRVLVVCLGALLIWQSTPFDERRDRSAERYARAVMNETPTNGILLLADYSTTFGTWWLRAIEGERPDVIAAFHGRLAPSEAGAHSDWHRRRLSTVHPNVLDALNEYPASLLRPGVRWEMGFFMLGNLPGGGRLITKRQQQTLVPSGLTAGVGDRWPTPENAEKSFGVFTDSTVAGRRLRASLHVLFIHQIFQSGGPPTLIRWHFNQLKALAPNDPMTLELEGGLKPMLLDQSKDE